MVLCDIHMNPGPINNFEFWDFIKMLEAVRRNSDSAIHINELE